MILLTTLHVLGTIPKIKSNITQVKNIINDKTNVTVPEINQNVKEVKQYLNEDHGKWIFIFSLVLADLFSK